MNDPYHCLLSDLNKKKLDINANANANTTTDEVKENKTISTETEKKNMTENKDTTNDKVKEEKANEILEYFSKKITNSKNIRNTLILTILYILLNSPLISNIIKEKAEFLFTEGVYNNLGKIFISLILSSVFIFSV